MSDDQPLIVLAAGGTGGHVFPAEALARELLGRGFRVALFTDRRGGKFGDDLSVPLYPIRACSLGKGLFAKARALVEMGIGAVQASRLLRKMKPAAVVGFGGYPSLPTLFAAVRRGIPIVLHEQNAVMGRANKSMLTHAQVVATSFPKVVGLKALRTKVVHTGNPVRPAFASLRATPYAPITDEGPIRILVLGGSLGASVFGRVVPKALALLPETIRHRLVVTQQCRANDLDEAKLVYAGAGIEAELASFFHDVPERMAEAQLVISRSGGGAIAELTALGRPAILVPYPNGIAGEQIANAEAVAEAGGAWLIPEQAFTPESLATRLESLLSLPSGLAKTAMAARAFGTVSAADGLANCVVDVISHAAVKKYSRD
jgi:UDP-N-acetylglucosamine--N-acetylmuramyl-(pentapeptide) pyrophosphoryl-undecaprenol N-acetylglucosamine transferase